MTIRLTTTSVGAGFIIGTLLGMARICQYRPLRTLAAIYIDFIRSTPLLVQIFLVYMGLPQLLSFPMPRLTAAFWR